MRFTQVVSVAAIGVTGAIAQNATTGKLGDAIPVTNNPVGKSVVGTLPEKPFWTAGSIDGNVKGSITAKSAADGKGVEFTVNFSNLPKEGGPFPYHLHVDPVPESGNCTSTLAHLDPYIRGEDPVCDAAAPATCQVGDLSGKWGKITSDPFTDTFVDPYASLVDGIGSYFANRSYVVHFANKTRITCANFVAAVDNSTYTPSASGTIALPTTTSVPTSVVTAAANALGAAKNFAVAPLLALMLAL
ncbi:superoxide dismutase [Xylariomycetidae sp. FL2044]|nr:superoxide dismutase [Xylariomycetidae sp. FL2044]